MPDTGELGEYKDAISRRKMLALTGASGMAALAGCGSGDTTTEEGPGATATETETETETEDGETPSGGDTTTEEPVEVQDATYVSAYTGNPSDLHFNGFAAQNISWPARRAVFAPALKYSFNASKFLDGQTALDNVEVNAEEELATLTLRDDITWDDGQNYTAEDLALQMEMYEKVGASITGYVSDWEAVDDTTLELSLDGPTNPQILKFELCNVFLETREDTHGDFADQPQEELLQWEWHGDETPIPSTAMWSFIEKDRQKFAYERNSDFYKANNVNFSDYRIQSFGGNTAQHQALMNPENVDAAISLFTPPEVADQFPDIVEEVNIPAKWGYGMTFNHEDDHYGQREVRQAIAHAINRQAVVDNAGPRTKFVSEIPCGIAPRDQEYWLDDWYDSFETYSPRSKDTDTAAQLMEEAGFSKDGGTWKDGNGNAVGGDYGTPAGWTDWTTMTQTVVSQLQDFGINLSVSSAPTNDWSGRMAESNFAISAHYWLPGGSRSAFPYFPLYYQLWGSHINGGHNYRDIAQSAQTVTGPDGGEMTLDTPLSETEKIAQQGNDEDARPFVQRSAWYNHLEMPYLGLVSKFEQSWTTTDEWTVASEDSPNRQVKWPQYWQVHEGDIQYTG